MNQDYLTVGERIKLADNKTYFCLNIINHDSHHYALLVTDNEKLEICFVEQTQNSLRIIGGKEEKRRLKQLFEESAASHDGEKDVQ